MRYDLAGLHSRAPLFVESAVFIMFEQVMDHYRDFLDTRGQAELAAVAAASQQWDADFDLEAVPDIPQADLPLQPSQVCCC